MGLDLEHVLHGTPALATVLASAVSVAAVAAVAIDAAVSAVVVVTSILRVHGWDLR